MIKKPPISRGLMLELACVSYASKCNRLNLILGESAVATSIAVLYGNKRGSEVNKTSINYLFGGFKAEKTTSCKANRAKRCICECILHVYDFHK